MLRVSHHFVLHSEDIQIAHQILRAKHVIYTIRFTFLYTN